MSELLDELLSKPIGKPVVNAPMDDVTTRSIEIDSRTGTATLTLPIAKGTPTIDAQGTALEFLKEEGQNPLEWEPVWFKKIRYGNPASPFESVRFTYKRIVNDPTATVELDIDDLISRVETIQFMRKTSIDKAPAAVVGAADWQYGKVDGDGVEGTLTRVFGMIDETAAILERQGGREHIVNGFLADMCEGFVSQGGTNSWRTPLALTDQIRLVRRSMLYCMERFAPLCDTLTMIAVPGNHDQAIRIGGKGVTRYDDSHDIECLVAVHDAAKFNPDAFGHVQFITPGPDEITVVTDIAGLRTGFTHGHHFKPGKGHAWWQGQAYAGGPLRDAKLLVTGHYHTFNVEVEGDRWWIQLAAGEGESTWVRHAKGPKGDPAMTLIDIENAQVAGIRQIRGTTPGEDTP